MKMKNKWLLVVFIITAIVSIFVFVYYKGYEGMFDFTKKEKPDTTKVEVVEQTLQVEESTIDTIYIYRVIIGSFKSLENAEILSDSIPFSDILITDDGWYRVSENYYFDKEDAQIERDLLGEDVWILKDFLLLEI